MNKSFLILIVFLVSCAPNKSQQDSASVTSKQEYQYNQKMKETNSLIQGTYKGQIKTYSGTSIPVEIGFFESLTKLGSNSEGESKIIPVLKARFRRLDTFQRFQILDARFFKENGSIVLSSQMQGSASEPKAASNEFQGEDYSIDGILQGGSLNAKVTVRSGNLGLLEAKLVDSNVIASPQGESNEWNQLLKEKMDKVVGEYSYEITLSDRTFTGTLNIVISLSNANSSSPEYVLVGSMSETTSTLFRGTVPFLISYKPELSPEGIFFSKVSSNTDNFSFNFTGQLVNTEITGNLITTRGIGKLVAKRK